MKAINRLITTTIALVTFCAPAVAGSDWMTDIDAAIAKGKTEKKAVMVEFTGSDWCPPCIMMHEKVFSQKNFTAEASKKYILAVIDIPNKDPELKKKNSLVMKKYKVRGVPTVILFGDDGKEFSRFSASQFPSVDAFLTQLDGELEKKDMD